MKRMNNEESVKENVLEQYKAQSEGDGEIHFEHYDWTYNDSSCCC